MHIHTVYFWLRNDLNDEQRAAFKRACTGLGSVSSVRECKVGTPIASERAVVDDTFSFSLHLRFDNTNGHDAYQVDPRHDAFIEEYKDMWDRVVVYDSHIA